MTPKLKHSIKNFPFQIVAFLAALILLEAPRSYAPPDPDLLEVLLLPEVEKEAKIELIEPLFTNPLTGQLESEAMERFVSLMEKYQTKHQSIEDAGLIAYSPMLQGDVPDTSRQRTEARKKAYEQRERVKAILTLLDESGPYGISHRFEKSAKWAQSHQAALELEKKGQEILKSRTHHLAFRALSEIMVPHFLAQNPSAEDIQELVTHLGANDRPLEPSEQGGRYFTESIRDLHHHLLTRPENGKSFESALKKATEENGWGRVPQQREKRIEFLAQLLNRHLQNPALDFRLRESLLLAEKRDEGQPERQIDASDILTEMMGQFEKGLTQKEAPEIKRFVEAMEAHLLTGLPEKNHSTMGLLLAEILEQQASRIQDPHQVKLNEENGLRAAKKILNLSQFQRLLALAQDQLQSFPPGGRGETQAALDRVQTSLNQIQDILPLQSTVRNECMRFLLAVKKSFKLPSAPRTTARR